GDADRPGRGQYRGDAERHRADQQAEPHGAVDEPLTGEAPPKEPDRLVLLDLEHARRHEHDPEDEDQPHDRRERDQWPDEWAHADPSPCESARKTSTILQKRPVCSRYA